MGKTQRIIAEESKSGRPCLDLRRTRNGVGAQNRKSVACSPAALATGTASTVCRLQQKGVFEKIFAELTKDEIPEELSLDSTFVKVHCYGLGSKKGTKNI